MSTKCRVFWFDLVNSEISETLLLPISGDFSVHPARDLYMFANVTAILP